MITRDAPGRGLRYNRGIMNQEVLAYLPVLSPIVTLVVIILGVFAQNRHVDNRVGDLRAVVEASDRALLAELRLAISESESRTKLAMSEMEGRLSRQISALETRVERLEGQRLVR